MGGPPSGPIPGHPGAAEEAALPSFLPSQAAAGGHGPLPIGIANNGCSPIDAEPSPPFAPQTEEDREQVAQAVARQAAAARQAAFAASAAKPQWSKAEAAGSAQLAARQQAEVKAKQWQQDQSKAAKQKKQEKEGQDDDKSNGDIEPDLWASYTGKFGGKKGEKGDKGHDKSGFKGKGSIFEKGFGSDQEISKGKGDWKWKNDYEQSEHQNYKGKGYQDYKGKGDWKGKKGWDYKGQNYDYKGSNTRSEPKVPAGPEADIDETKEKLKEPQGHVLEADSEWKDHVLKEKEAIDVAKEEQPNEQNAKQGEGDGDQAFGSQEGGRGESEKGDAPESKKKGKPWQAKDDETEEPWHEEEAGYAYTAKSSQQWASKTVDRGKNSYSSSSYSSSHPEMRWVPRLQSGGDEKDDKDNSDRATAEVHSSKTGGHHKVAADWRAASWSQWDSWESGGSQWRGAKNQGWS